jgi:nitroreductase
MKMKVTLLILSLLWILPGLLPAEPVETGSNDMEHSVQIEDAAEKTSSATVSALLDMELSPVNDEAAGHWHYQMVHSNKAKRKLLNAFLAHLQSYHRHSKLPFRAVAKYWDEIFDKSTQIFVFSENGDQTELFCTSSACETLVMTAHMLGLGFIWNGALGIAEDEIKEILEVPAEYSLVMTIFLNPVEGKEITQALP